MNVPHILLNLQCLSGCGNILNIQFERELKARQQTVSVPEERRNTIIWEVKELLDAPQ